MRKSTLILSALLLTATAAAQTTAPAPLPACVTVRVVDLGTAIQINPVERSTTTDTYGITHNYYGAWLDLVYQGKSSPVTTSGLMDWQGEPMKGIHLYGGGLFLNKVKGLQVQEKLGRWELKDARFRFVEYWQTCAVL